MSQRLLFIALEDYRIEVNEVDYVAVVEVPGEYQRERELKLP